MSASYNFKKIVDILKQIQHYHEQLQAFGIGDIPQLIYYTEERLKQNNTDQNLAPYYPLLYVVPESATNDGRVSIYTFNILCMDILNTKNFDNEIDVWSDTLDILKDVVGQLKFTIGGCYCDWNIDYPVDFTPFSEKFDDYVSGWTARIRIRIPDPMDRCIAPFDIIPGC